MHKLVLCDVDETILNPEYTTNSRRFKQKIQEMQRMGIIIGLNSDTPARRLQKLRVEWGMNGPVIAELGGVIEFAGSKHYLREYAKWKSLYQTILINLSDDSQYFVVSGGDVLELAQNNADWGIESGWVLLNAWRETSFSCFFSCVAKRKVYKRCHILTKSIYHYTQHDKT